MKETRKDDFMARTANMAPPPADEKENAKVTKLLPYIKYRRMAEIEPEKIAWLWRGRIPRAKTTLIAGDPGLGKSQLTISLAAIASTGGCWPVDRTNSPRGNVVILSAEDDAADTIRPRLDAAGADVSRIYTIDAVVEPNHESLASTERPVSLDKDIQRLARMIQKVGDVVLVIIDPISAYLGGTDSHKNADMRGLLAPLGKLAADAQAAIVCVSHLNKSTGSNALGRVMGSLAFVAAVRAAYIVTKDPDDETRRLFLPLKNNLGPDDSGLAYHIEPVTTDGIETSRISWCADPVTKTADDVLAVTVVDDSGGELGEAAEWLREILGDGPMSGKEVKAIARQVGFSERTVQRAMSEAGVQSRREGYGPKSTTMWVLGDTSRAKGSPSHKAGATGAIGATADMTGLQRTDKKTEIQSRQPTETGANDDGEDS